MLKKLSIKAHLNYKVQSFIKRVLKFLPQSYKVCIRFLCIKYEFKKIFNLTNFLLSYLLNQAVCQSFLFSAFFIQF